MLALHQNERGDVSTFQLGPVAKPAPAAGEVLVRVHAASLNPIDLKRNGLDLAEAWPVVLGYDVAGVVDEVGAGVTQFQKGDRVAGDIMADSIGIKAGGTVAEFCACAAAQLAKIPDALSMTDAAALPLVAQTALVVLREAGARAGESVFVTAGAGGVGIHLMQIAKACFGAAAVGTTVSAAKEQLVRKHGADVVVDYRKENAGEVCKGWADVVVDCTGEVEMGRKILKEGGRLVTIVDVMNPDVNGVVLQATGELMQEVVDIWEKGQIVPVIDTIYPLKDAVKAAQHLAGGRSTGKVIVQVQ